MKKSSALNSLCGPSAGNYWSDSLSNMSSDTTRGRLPSGFSSSVRQLAQQFAPGLNLCDPQERLLQEAVIRGNAIGTSAELERVYAVDLTPERLRLISQGLELPDFDLSASGDPLGHRVELEVDMSLARNDYFLRDFTRLAPPFSYHEQQSFTGLARQPERFFAWSQCGNSDDESPKRVEMFASMYHSISQARGLVTVLGSGAPHLEKNLTQKLSELEATIDSKQNTGLKKAKHVAIFVRMLEEIIQGAVSMMQSKDSGGQVFVQFQRLENLCFFLGDVNAAAEENLPGSSDTQSIVRYKNTQLERNWSEIISPLKERQKKYGLLG